MSKSNLKNLIKSESMTLKLETLLNSAEGLHKIANLKLPVSVSFKVGKTIKAIQNELDAYTEVKNKRVKELGKAVLNDKGEPTNRYEVTPENTELWQEESKALMEKEVEIEVYKLSLSDLGEEKLEPFIFSQLDWLITE